MKTHTDPFNLDKRLMHFLILPVKSDTFEKANNLAYLCIFVFC